MTSPLRRGVPIVAGCFGAMVVAVIAAPFIGSTSLTFSRVFSTSVPFADNVDAQIFFVARLPRALAAALVGGTLAAAGVVFQGLLRNPLTTPYTLGVSAGAFLAVAIVYALAAARHRGLSTTVMLLAGVTLNAFFSALILFVQYVSDYAQTYRALRWLMGDLDVVSYTPLVGALPFVGVALLTFAWL